MKKEWLKIQPPLHGNGGMDEVLIYNKSKSVEYIIFKRRLSDKIKNALCNSPSGKIFAEGRLIQNTGYDIEFRFKGKIVDSTDLLYSELTAEFFNSPRNVRKNAKKEIKNMFKSGVTIKGWNNYKKY